ncbi:MAG: Aromatic amino acid permease [Candidatus Yanofskybacteria bacterium GW2011_GWA1_41_6]|uniref:Aromatic amino acid permease n=1 Tax=Candidatus Yanofskybacteria bacterium GW2011_GWA1_41_6 TaxID=1619020 RepID=A0A0G0ZIH8_9BACT|nr:MAG: Aromatic amino acid permease [Candidatus Yanofskybacteria bacterium GW2011_GWA1_41_6]
MNSNKVKILDLNLLKNRNFLYATTVLIGTMVGVGIFGIPFTFAKAGFWVGFLFLIFIGFITLLLNLMYGEVILRTHEEHQITGYTEKYLGIWFKRAIFFSVALGLYSALLAYTVIAGDFLNNIFSSVFYASPTSYSLVFFFVLSILILLGIRRISWVELLLVGLFAVVVLSILGVGINKINLSNFTGIQPEFWFLPYGVLLFAFAGFSAIPIQRDILRSQENNFKKSILLAVLLTSALYLLFAFTVLGISGEVTTPDAVSGLYEFLGSKIIFLGSLFGILAVSTSFLMLGSAFLDMFHLDYNVPRKLAWLLVVAPPLVLFLGGLRTFIDIISLAGSVAIGLEGVVLTFVYIKSKSKGDRVPEYSLELPKFIYYLLIFMFGAGIVYALFIK